MKYLEAQVPYIKTEEDKVTLSYEQRTCDALTIEQPHVRVRDGRSARDALSLDEQGFILVDAPSRVVRDHGNALVEENRLPSEEVGPMNEAYLAELQPLMLQLSVGAREVFAQYGTMTVRFSQRSANRSWLTTAQFAHFDFARSEIDRQLRETLELTRREIKPFRRQVMLQGWRVITPPPQDNTLVLCDGRTVSADDVLGLDFIGPKGSRNELLRSRVARYNPKHEWYYFPRLTPDELLVFKGFDSDSPDSNTALHTAFDDPSVSAADLVPRGSVECRFIALYD